MLNGLKIKQSPFFINQLKKEKGYGRLFQRVIQSEPKIQMTDNAKDTKKESQLGFVFPVVKHGTKSGFILCKDENT